MLKILWKRGEIALLLSTIFCYLMLDFYVKTGIRFSLRDNRLFKITEVEITGFDCMWHVHEKYADPYFFFLHRSCRSGVMPLFRLCMNNLVNRISEEPLRLGS